MSDRELGSIQITPGEFPRSTVYYSCGDCNGWYSHNVGGGLGLRRRSPDTPATIAARARRESQRQADEHRLRAKLNAMSPCSCGPKTPPPRRPAQTQSSKPRTARAAPVASAGSNPLMADLSALVKLWESGALTDQEFAAAKANLLGTSNPDIVPVEAQSGRPPAPAPGWYPEPSGSALRYWNGSRWTDFTHRPADPPTSGLSPDDAGTTAVSDPPVSRFNVGDRVAHPRFGEGVVVESYGDGKEVVVNFGELGRRSLVTQFAKLRRLP